MKLIKEITILPDQVTKKNPFKTAVVKFKDGTQQEFTKQRLREEKFKEEQWQEYTAKTIKYFNRDLKEGTEDYNSFQEGDL